MSYDPVTLLTEKMETTGLFDTLFDYDDRGRLISTTVDTRQTFFSYNASGFLASVTDPQGRTTRYRHDAKKIDGITVEKYLWQGMTRLLAIYDGADNLIMRFEYADGRMPLAMVKNGIRYYLSYDQVGSLRIIADSAGNVVKRINYDAFGNILSDSDPGFTVPFGFAGGLHDRDTGLIRFGYRDYDPDTGRWTAKDPILFDGGGTDLYGYVLENPVNFTDPFGLYLTDSQKAKVSIVSAVGSAIGTFFGSSVGGAIGGAVGGVAASFAMEGSNWRDNLNSAITGAISGLTGSGVENLLKGTLMYGMKAALTTGTISGLVESLLLEGDPIIKAGKPCK